MIFIGIDPSQRHTGICIMRTPEDYVLSQIDTTVKDDLATSVKIIRRELRKGLFGDTEIPFDQYAFGIERMIPGAMTSPLMFAVQTIVYDEILDFFGEYVPSFTTPYPVQLKAYMSRHHGVDIKNKKTGIIQGYKRITGDEARVSSHRAEAYFLARMAQDVIEGRWSFKQKPQKLRMFPWE